MKSTPTNRTLPESTFFITTNLAREKLFTNEKTLQIIWKTLDFYRKRADILLFGFVFMPDHTHMLVKINESITLPRFMNGMKAYVANQLGGRSIWQKSYWSELITDDHHFIEKLKYIHSNPVRAGIVETQTDFIWSSASDYENGNANKRIDYFS